jgi:carbon-monoxide dehydrogenase medium subunit
MRDFEYFEPKSIDEVISLLSRYKGEAQILAGGTDLLVRMHQNLIKPKYVINVAAAISGLDFIKYENGTGLKIGALTTIRALEKSVMIGQKYPILAQAAKKFGNIAIRNMATIGGNLCRGNPTADSPPVLLALSAHIKIVGHSGEKVMPLDDFFVGPGRTILQPDELLVEIDVPELHASTSGAYLKYSLRGTDLAIVGVAVVITIDQRENLCKDVKIALAGAAPTPMRALGAEKILRHKPIDEEVIESAAQAAADEARPREHSFRATPEYRRRMIKVFTAKAIRETLTQLQDRVS